MKADSKASSVLALLLLVLLLVSELQVEVEAVTCSPMQLSPCASAITSSTAPSSLCCGRIKQQKPCLCQYLNNPNLRKFIDSPNARKVATQCGTPFPKC